jgi:hypothetical protein
MSKRPGRPALTPGEPPARVQVRVAAADYDRAYQCAQQEGVSVAELLRRGLSHELARRRREDDDDRDG